MTPVAAVLTLARTALSLVFLTAGAFKLVDPFAASALEAFGLTAAQARLVSRLLPGIELGVGAALLWPDTSVSAGLAGVVLLLAFTIVIATALRRGQAPPCNCFGALEARPIDRRTLWRNVALIALALIVVGLGTQSPEALQAGATARFAPLAVLGALVAALLVTLRRQAMVQHELRTAVTALERELDRRDTPPAPKAATPGPGLPFGAPLPDAEVTTLQGEARPLSAWLDPMVPSLLVALGAECGSCRELYPQIRTWAAAQRGRLRIVALYDRAPDSAPSVGPDVSVVVAPKDLLAAIRLQWTPGAVLVSAARTVASQTVFGSPAIESLVTTLVSAVTTDSAALATALKVASTGLAIGAEAPAIEGIDVTGDRVVVFWRAGCPYCRNIKPSLDRALTAVSPPVALVAINWSASEAMDLDAPTVRDAPGAIAAILGARGTPSAVRIGADGRVQSPVVVGGPDVLALVGAAPVE